MRVFMSSLFVAVSLALAAGCQQKPGADEAASTPPPTVAPPEPGSMSGEAPTTVNPLPEGQAPPQAQTPPNKPPAVETKPG